MRVIPRFLRRSQFYPLRAYSSDGFGSYEPGRQGTGYMKLRLKEVLQAAEHDPKSLLRDLLPRALGALGCPADNEFYDVFLLKYPKGAYIPKHVDEAGVFGKTHHRLNALVTSADKGGHLTVDDKPIEILEGHALVFRPDEQPHAVSEVLEGGRLVLSVGCWL